MADSDHILTRVDGTVGVVTLNRPKVINALTHSMITTLHSTLREWANDPQVSAVMVNGAGERGLCSGGDVVAVYDSVRADGSAARALWFDEYRLNAFIADFPKPYVALMDGLVMGGGVGVSAHGDVRVVTDTSRIAMPEVGIGLVPDVGGTYLLAGAPQSAGLHAALTGAPFDGADAIALGLADHYVPHDSLPTFTSAVVDDGIDVALAAHAVPPPPSRLLEQDWIPECYGADTVRDVVAALRRRGGPADDAADLIESRSPVSVAVTFESIHRAAAMPDLKEALVQEYRVSCAASASHDLEEGIRAQIIDKDRNPRWSPATLADVTPADVAAYFQPVEPELTFDAAKAVV